MKLLRLAVNLRNRQRQQEAGSEEDVDQAEGSSNTQKGIMSLNA